jgi:hypothetical protein
MVVAAAMGTLNHPRRTDALVYGAAMVLLILVGLVGAVLHVQENLTAQSILVPERFLRSAPLLAPLLFCNMGLLGLIALLDPHED